MPTTILTALACALLLQASPQDTASTTADVSRAQRIESLGEATSALLLPADIPIGEDEFADLGPLARAVDGRRIVTLGEAAHSDGTAFEVKARLVRFLHERCGFDVLVFEAGFYECDRAWRSAVAGESLVEQGRRALQPIWERSEVVQDLLAYQQSTLTTDRPLQLAGMDMMPTGSLLMEAAGDVEEVALAAGVDPMVVEEGLFLLAGMQTEFRRVIVADAEERRFALGPMEELGAALREAAKSETIADDLRQRAALCGQFLPSFVACVEMLAVADLSNPEGGPELNRRDGQMAANVVWLAEEMFPGKKLIVWGATSHLSRKRTLLDVHTARKMVPVGEHLARALPWEVYHLAVTAYGGAIGSALDSSPIDLEPARRGSLEELWAATGNDAAFLDFTHLPESAAWLRGTIGCRAMGHADVDGRWAECVDGLVLLREMAPVVGRD